MIYSPSDIILVLCAVYISVSKLPIIKNNTAHPAKTNIWLQFVFTVVKKTHVYIPLNLLEPEFYI